MAHNPWFWLFIGWFLFSSVVGTMPAPDEKDGKGYRWAYAALHSIAANFKTAYGAFRNGNGLPAGPIDPHT
jgi:hypothetical protein